MDFIKMADIIEIETVLIFLRCRCRGFIFGVSFLWYCCRGIVVAVLLSRYCCRGIVVAV